MTVVADTSPLNYLVLIDTIDVLPQLFGRVLIPEAVALELRRPRTPPEVASWLTAQPAWLVIQAPPNLPRNPQARNWKGLVQESGRQSCLLPSIALTYSC